MTGTGAKCHAFAGCPACAAVRGIWNINHGHNGELMEKCRVLREYAAFVELFRQYLARGMEPKAALEAAIADCIRQDILAEFLRTYRAEVLGMLLEEFDVKKFPS